jgi:GT2 family glycosyltransferase
MPLGIVQPEAPPTRLQATFDASIVIPTHDRCSLLERALEHLAAQTYDISRIEVIVILDGCTDGTEEMLRSREWPFSLRYATQEQRGAGASRNAGAQIAQAPVMIFVDDDIMVAPDFVEQHLHAYGDGTTSVVIGLLAPDPSADVPGWWRWVEWQLDKQYKAMQAGRRSVGGRALYSGNFSVKRETFLRVGGFDEELPHSEDVELGLRLERDGAKFHLAPDAKGAHWGHRTYATWLTMAYKYGRWDGALAVNPQYPFAWEQLFAAYRRRSLLLRLFAKRLLDHYLLAKWVRRLFRLGSIAAGAVRISAIERSLYAGMYDLVYWQAVCDELGSARVLWRVLRRKR